MPEEATCIQESYELSVQDTFYVRIGRFIDASTAGTFDYQMRVLEMSNMRYAVLDMRDCEYINSSGIESIINLSHRLPQNNGCLILLRPQQAVIDSLNLMGVLDDFRVVDDVAEAEDFVRSIWQPAPPLE